MRASEFVREVTDPKNPPAPGSQEYNATFNSFKNYINQFIKNYENTSTALKNANRDDNRNFKQELRKYLIDRGSSYVLDSDLEKIPYFSTQLQNPNIIQPKTAQQTTATAKPDWKQQRAQQWSKTKTQKNTPTTTTTTIGSTATTTKLQPSSPNTLGTALGNVAKANAARLEPVQKLEPIKIGGETIKPDDPRYAKIMQRQKKESVNEAEQPKLSDKEINDIAEVLTNSFYSNRKLAATNKQAWLQVGGKPDIFQGGNSNQKVLSSLTGIDPRDPQFGQALSNILSKKDTAEKFAAKLKQYVPPKNTA
jgi:hypothetical protein